MNEESGYKVLRVMGRNGELANKWVVRSPQPGGWPDCPKDFDSEPEAESWIAGWDARDHGAPQLIRATNKLDEAYMRGWEFCDGIDKEPDEPEPPTNEWLDGVVSRAAVGDDGYVRLPLSDFELLVSTFRMGEGLLAESETELERIRAAGQLVVAENNRFLSDRRKLQEQVGRLRKREAKFAALFEITDGGKHEADWESKAEAIRQMERQLSWHTDSGEVPGG